MNLEREAFAAEGGKKIKIKIELNLKKKNKKPTQLKVVSTYRNLTKLKKKIK